MRLGCGQLEDDDINPDPVDAFRIQRKIAPELEHAFQNAERDASTLKPHHILPGVSNVLAFSQDGRAVSIRREDGKVAFCEVATGKVQREDQTPLPVENGNPRHSTTIHNMVGRRVGKSA